MSVYKPGGNGTREASHGYAPFCSSTLIRPIPLLADVTSLSLAALVGLLPMNAGSVFLKILKTRVKSFVQKQVINCKMIL